MEKKAKICILGSNSGRNAGDAAILASIMSSLSKELDGKVSFEVPTTHPEFVQKHYGEMFDVKAISVMPWTGSIRLLGIPTFRSIARTDVTLITDGIIFDVNLWNPLFNFLITLIFLVPWARLFGKKVVCYNVGIGPLRSRAGRLFARWVGNGCDLIMVREEDSKALFEEIGVTKEVHLTADAVFVDWAATEERVQEILDREGLSEPAEANKLLGVNVTRYVDHWLAKDEKLREREGFIPMCGAVLARLRVEKGICPVVFSTQIMDADFARKLCQSVSEEIEKLNGEKWKPVCISNEVYDNHELIGLASKCRLFIGMRLHSAIIAARAGSPVLGFVYAPKVRSFLAQLNTPEWAIEIAEANRENLFSKTFSAWEASGEIRNTQQAVVCELVKRAQKAARMLKERYFA